MLCTSMCISLTKLAATGPVLLSKQHEASENDCGSNVWMYSAAEPYQSILTCAVYWHQLKVQLVFSMRAGTTPCTRAALMRSLLAALR